MTSSFRRNFIKANVWRTKKGGEESWLTKKDFDSRIIYVEIGVLPP
jgi:hypothetical protein